MKQTVHMRGGWRQEENDLLFAQVKEAAAEGLPLRDVFLAVGEKLNRKPNSIRNYYYAKVKEDPALAPSKATFRAFDRDELHQLLRDVLIAKGQGESVRACVIRRAGGDRSAMLRYQNKYRSVLKNRPELLLEVAEELRREGLPCPENVVACRRYGAPEAAGSLSRLPVGWEKEPGVAAMLDGLNMLLRRMEAQTAALRERAEAERAGERAAERSQREALPTDLLPTDALPADTLLEKTTLSQAAETDDFLSHVPSNVERLSQGTIQTATQADQSTMQVPYDKWLKARQEADRLRVEVDLLKIALEEAEQGKTAEPQET